MFVPPPPAPDSPERLPSLASSTSVFHWRQALGVERLGTEGSRSLRQAPNEELGARLRDEPLPYEQGVQLSEQAIRLNLGRNLRLGSQGPRWTPEQLPVLGTDTEEAVAAQIGRTVKAVTVQCLRRGIPIIYNRRRREHGARQEP